MNKRKIWSQELYLKALRFAAEAHKEQHVPGTELPYIIHPVSVCMEIMAAISIRECDDPDLAVCCALLHDTIEDTSVTFRDLELSFGRDTAKGVLALSKNKSLEKIESMTDSVIRIKEQRPEVWMVKLADRITNLQPPPSHWTEDKIINYRDEAEFILKELGDASPFLGSRLAEKIINYG